MHLFEAKKCATIQTNPHIFYQGIFNGKWRWEIRREMHVVPRISPSFEIKMLKKEENKKSGNREGGNPTR